jgi:hypothetical protein
MPIRKNFPIIVIYILWSSLGLQFLFSFFTPSLAQQEQKAEDHSKLLIELAHYELDHYNLIGFCLDNIKNTHLRAKLRARQNECEANSRDLADLIRRYGIEPPLQRKETKGLFFKGYAVMKSGMTEQGALKVLRENGLIILNAFKEASRAQLTPHEQEVVTKIYEKQKSFVQFLYLQTSQCLVKEGFDARR